MIHLNIELNEREAELVATALLAASYTGDETASAYNDRHESFRLGQRIERRLRDARFSAVSA